MTAPVWIVLVYFVSIVVAFVLGLRTAWHLVLRVVISPEHFASPLLVRWALRRHRFLLHWAAELSDRFCPCEECAWDRSIRSAEAAERRGGTCRPDPTARCA